MKENILVICSDKQTNQRIADSLPADYCSLIFKEGAEEGTGVIRELADVSAVLIDAPSKVDGIRDFIDYVDSNNNYLFATAILILTDEATVDEDIEFIGGVVLDCVLKPVHPLILKNRIELAQESIRNVSFEEFADMLKVLPSNIFLKDTNGHYIFMSHVWDHFDKDDDDPNWTVFGKTDMEIRRNKENAKLAMESDRRLLSSGKGTSYVIQENADGADQYLQLVKEPLYYEDGRAKGVIALINDVTEQELLKRKLQEMSVKDKLTGIYNRSYFDEYIQLLDNNDKYPLSIISADCDDLKMINDTYGHMAGDDYIKKTVELLDSVLPEKSIMFRTGGDEFIICIPNSSDEEAISLVNELKASLSGYTVEGHTLSVSFGCSTMYSGGEDFSEHLKAADSGMYYDKHKKKAAKRSEVN